jgi:ABC-type glycerol-3-phosphate transport system permease component
MSDASRDSRSRGTGDPPVFTASKRSASLDNPRTEHGRVARATTKPSTMFGRGALHLLLIALAALSLAPFFWLVCATFKLHEDFFTYNFLPWSDPSRWTLSNYAFLFREYPFAGWMLNSLFLATSHTVLVVTLSSLGGFALAKYEFAGKKPLSLVMLATMLLPSQVLLGSSRELMQDFGWIDSYAAILVPGAVSVFGMFLFMQAMKGVPDELLQAGRVDGCSELRLWWEVALPIIRPMIGAYTLLSFMGSWNSFLWPQIVLQSSERFTLPIALTSMIGLPEYEAPLGGLMAGTLLSIVPIALLFFILQRDFIAGLASGAVKG